MRCVSEQELIAMFSAYFRTQFISLSLMVLLIGFDSLFNPINGNTFDVISKILHAASVNNALI
jgi:hypothetical protein